MAEKKNVVRELIENGRRTGKLTTHEINDALEESAFDVDQLENCMNLWKATASRSWTMSRTPPPRMPLP